MCCSCLVFAAMCVCLGSFFCATLVLNMLIVLRVLAYALVGCVAARGLSVCGEGRARPRSSPSKIPTVALDFETL